MHIAAISTIEDFNDAQARYDAVYRADEAAPIFLSHTWLRGWLQTSPHEWMILAASPTTEAPPVAYLPLSRMPSPSAARPDRVVTVRMGGWPASDYTGMISEPPHADAAARALMSHLSREIIWDTCELHDLADERLIRAAAIEFGEGIRESARRETPCPRVGIPADWDTFLQEKLGYSSRGTLRRRIKRLERREDYRVADVTPDTVDAITGVAFRLWQARFPDDVSLSDQPRYRALFETMVAEDRLWARAMYVDDQPIAGAVGFFDDERSAFRYYLTGYDNAWHKMAPGRVMLAYAIQAAMARGLTVFDFLRGDEAYKRDFGAEDVMTESVTFRRVGIRTTLRLRIAAAKRSIRS